MCSRHPMSFIRSLYVTRGIGRGEGRLNGVDIPLALISWLPFISYFNLAEWWWGGLGIHGFLWAMIVWWCVQRFPLQNIVSPFGIMLAWKIWLCDSCSHSGISESDAQIPKRSSTVYGAFRIITKWLIYTGIPDNWFLERLHFSWFFDSGILKEGWRWIRLRICGSHLVYCVLLVNQQMAWLL